MNESEFFKSSLPLFLILSILPYAAIVYAIYRYQRPRKRDVEALVRPGDAAIAEPPGGEKR